ncbi:MAG: energy transducer TonB [Bacteroidetes bacterium]|nr:energy transducer TonB [Rhodothermia bacterium]MCS7155151.1 energy transducer TonB [Bacteroidota bacterium]MCX7906222.1 energy transducer TonB [Bacteroidota bacterium]MDW8138349.1 energy transducer TonB [Bacteroidota bacterium]MDW8286034.1 energy transducer TonB [Bacteroidota bacterium]
MIAAAKTLAQLALRRRGRARGLALPAVRGLRPMLVRAHADRRTYALRLAVGLALALSLLTGLLRLPLAPSGSFLLREAPQEAVSLQLVEQTVQPERPPAAPLPLVPIAVPDEKPLAEEPVLTASSELVVGQATPVSSLAPPAEAPPPPPVQTPPSPSEPEVFVVVEEPPEIIGGLERLQQLIRYPDLARKAGIEGLVIVEVLVDPEGRPHRPQLIKRAGGGLDEAALEAVMQLSFKPGRQRGKAVWVRFAIPVRFRLQDPTRPPA